MNDVKVLRDHSQPCDHPSGHRQSETRDGKAIWRCFAAGCPGGKEITYQKLVYYEETFYMQDGDRYLVEADND